KTYRMDLWKARRKAHRQNQPRSGDSIQPTPQAVGQNQKTIQLRRSERTRVKTTPIQNPIRENTNGSSRPKPRSPAPWQATGPISAPYSNSPASATRTKKRRASRAVLLLEKILECRSRIHRPRGTGCGGFLFDSNPHGIKRTLIALVLARDPLGDGLRAFEAARSIEIRTLAAGVKFETALRTLPDRFRHGRQKGAALRASGNCMRARHLHYARAEGFFLDRLFPRRFFPLLAAVLIYVLAVFPVGHESLLYERILSRVVGIGTSPPRIRHRQGRPFWRGA